MYQFMQKKILEIGHWKISDSLRNLCCTSISLPDIPKYCRFSDLPKIHVEVKL